MIKKDFIVIVALPKPYNGQTIGSRIVANIFRKDLKVKILKSNINFYLTDSAGIFTKIKYFCLAFLKYVELIIKTWFLFFWFKCPNLYIVPSSNFRGLSRDILVFLPFFLFKKKIYCHIRSGSFNLSIPIFKYIYSRDNFRFIFLTKGLLQESCAPLKNSRVINNFIDELFDERLVSPAVKEIYTLRIVFLGNLFDSKGVFDAIKAVKLQGKNASISLQIYGKGERSVVARVRKEIEGFSNINYSGAVEGREKVRSIFANSDIFILPTTYPIEASPRSIIEAMSQGCIPLVTNHAGIPEMVDDRCAFIIDKGHNLVVQISSILQELIDDRTTLLQMKSAAAREHFIEHYSYNKLKMDLVDYFTE